MGPPNFYTMKVFAVIALASVVTATDTLSVQLKDYPEQGDTRSLSLDRKSGRNGRDSFKYASYFEGDKKKFREECSLQYFNGEWVLTLRKSVDHKGSDQFRYPTTGASLDSIIGSGSATWTDPAVGHNFGTKPDVTITRGRRRLFSFNR